MYYCCYNKVIKRVENFNNSSNDSEFDVMSMYPCLNKQIMSMLFRVNLKLESIISDNKEQQSVLLDTNVLQNGLIRRMDNINKTLQRFHTDLESTERRLRNTQQQVSVEHYYIDDSERNCRLSNDF